MKIQYLWISGKKMIFFSKDLFQTRNHILDIILRAGRKVFSIFKHCQYYQRNNLYYVGLPHSTFRSKAFILTCKSKVHKCSSQKPEDIVKSKTQESERNPEQENRRHR